MMNFGCASSFDSLYREFIKGSTGGKIFMMKDFHMNETDIGKGTIIILDRANPYILSLLVEKYKKDQTFMIGDVELLMKLAKINNEVRAEKFKEERIYHAVRAKKRQKQLYSILIRKHKSLEPNRFNLKMKKEE